MSMPPAAQRLQAQDRVDASVQDARSVFEGLLCELRRLRRLATLSVLGLTLLWPVLATAQDSPQDVDTIYAGDTVTVVSPSVELGLKDKVVVELKAGGKIHVTEIRGDWIGGYATVDGERYSGWVHRDEVKLVVISPEDVVTIEVPDQPDDPKAVEALKALGVQLDLNDKGNVYSADASESELDDTAMAHFGGLYQLSSLDVSNRPITDAGLKALPVSTVLQELYLDNCRASDQALEHLADFSNLEIISLRGTEVKGPGLSHLQALKTLETLNVSNCQIGDAALAHVGKMPWLEVLALGGTEVTSEGLKHLKPLERLRVLNLIGCDIDDDALPLLYGLSKLRMLYVRQTDVTDEGIEASHLETPSLAIFD